MNDSTTTDYIIQQLNAGLSPQDITTQLRQAGLDEASINDAFKQAREHIAPSAQPIPQQDAQTPAPTENAATTLPPAPKRGKLKTGWLLFKQSLSIIMRHPGLWRYMVMSIGINLVITIIFAGAILVDILTNQQLLVLQTSSGESDFTPTIALYGIAAIVVYISTVVSFFYATGLAAHTLALFKGSQSTYAQNIAVARQKLPAILTFSLITVTVGFLLRLLEQRFQLIGFIVARIIGLGWELATTFVIAIIADSNKNGASAIGESVQLFRATWGETITGRVSLAGLLIIIYLFVSVPLLIFLMIFLSSVMDPAIAIGIALAFFYVSILIIMTLEALTTNVLNVALYYYAKNKSIPPSFSPELLASAFVNKKKK